MSTAGLHTSICTCVCPHMDTPTYTLRFFKYQNNSGEKGQQLRVHAAPPEDPSSVPSTYMGRLTTT